MITIEDDHLNEGDLVRIDVQSGLGNLALIDFNDNYCRVVKNLGRSETTVTDDYLVQQIDSGGSQWETQKHGYPLGRGYAVFNRYQLTRVSL